MLKGRKINGRWSITTKAVESYRRDHRGNRKRNWSAEAIERRLAALRSPETRAKMRAAKVGTRQSPETVAKRIANQRGRHLSVEHRAKMSAAQKGRAFDPEHLAKLRKYHVTRRGKPMSIETRRRIAESLERAYAEGRRSYSTLEDRAATLLLPLGFVRSVRVDTHVFDFGLPDGLFLVEVNGCAWHDHRSRKPECPVQVRRDSSSRDEERRSIARLYDRILVELWQCEEATWPDAIALIGIPGPDA